MGASIRVAFLRMDRTAPEKGGGEAGRAESGLREQRGGRAEGKGRDGRWQETRLALWAGKAVPGFLCYKMTYRVIYYKPIMK